MNKDLLLKDIAESGYNIGYAAKKRRIPLRVDVSQ